MTKQTGGPAFPIVEYKQPVGGGSHMMTIIGGMTLRDYFAAKAMQSYVSHNKVYDFEDIAAVSFRVADAMLKAREQ